jgi:hypothetical protein
MQPNVSSQLQPPHYGETIPEFWGDLSKNPCGLPCDTFGNTKTQIRSRIDWTAVAPEAIPLLDRNAITLNG